MFLKQHHHSLWSRYWIKYGMNEYILYLLPRGTYSQLGDKFNNVYYYIKAVYGRIFSGFLIQSHCPTNVPFFSGAHFRSALIRVPHCSHSCAVTFKCIFFTVDFWFRSWEALRFPALWIHVPVESSSSPPFLYSVGSYIPFLKSVLLAYFSIQGSWQPNKTPKHPSIMIG